MDGNWRDYAEVVGDVCGLKIYNNSTTGNLLIEDQAVRGQHYAHWPGMAHGLPRPIAVHAEEHTVVEILELVREHRRFTHFCHISSAFEIRVLREAKEAGLPISVGVCPHHLWLTEDDLNTLGSFGLMKPELKTKSDRDALWQAISDGVVDVIESDHAPHTLAEKTSNKPPYGVPGLETTLPLLLTAAHQGRLDLEQVVALVADNPRRIWGLEAPPDTYTVVDLDESYTIERGRLRTKCGWSPFEGMRVQGRVIETWVRGQQIYDGESILVKQGYGANVYG
jgi:carbamoyl-phosphate synthase/aspartate carbamoyltransferase/dihydroorotase